MRAGCRMQKFSETFSKRVPFIDSKARLHHCLNCICRDKIFDLDKKIPSLIQKTLQTSKMKVDHIIVAPFDHHLAESSSTLPLVYTSSISKTCPCPGVCRWFSSLRVAEYSFCSFNICSNSRIMW